ncbi:hypothetical protein [Polynucleobacter arcticus]|uniref:hypothetical protein n=1 Tax=Polynucleobacter arcticus TaxID=1743165 RepID=UPI00156E5AFB|nr:hypothetical protein [Polynucleobacter arcticus]
MFIPFLLVEYPPLVDYPVHLSRQFILQNLESIPQLQVNYQLAWGIKPNLAMDLIVPILSIFLPLTLATKAFVMLSIALIVLGTLMLSKQIHGRIGVLPFASLLFVYNMALYEGHINYLFASGLMLVSFAVWLKLTDYSNRVQTASLSVLLIALFISHLFAMGLLCLCIFCYELAKAFTLRKFSIQPFLNLTIALVPLALLWLLKPAGPPSGGWDYGYDITTHIVALLSGAFFFDESDILTMICLCALFIVFAIVAFHKNTREGDKPFFLLVFALIIISPFVPETMMGGSRFVIRIPILIPFLILAIPPPAMISHRMSQYFLGTILILITCRTMNIANDWLSKNQDFSEFIAASQVISAGSRVIQARQESTGKVIFDMPYRHLTELLIPDKYIFVPHMAKIPDQQPIAPSKETASIDGGTASPITLKQLQDGSDPVISKTLLNTKMDGWQKPYWAFWPQNFDYLVFLHMREPQENPSPDHLKLIKAGSFFDIYQIQGRRLAFDYSTPNKQ